MTEDILLVTNIIIGSRITYSFSIGAKINALNDLEHPLRTLSKHVRLSRAHHENLNDPYMLTASKIDMTL